MKAPDKIYLHGYSFDDEPCKDWHTEPKIKGMRGYPAQNVEYIRKDFLLEWAKDRLMPGNSAEGKGWNWALQTLIDKLNSL